MTRNHIWPTDNRVFAPIDTPFERRLETLSVLIYLATIPFFLSLIFVSVYYAIWGSNRFFRQIFRLVLIIYTAYYVKDFKRPFRGPLEPNKPFLKFMRPWLTRYRNYFPIKAVLTQEADATLMALKDSPRPVIFGSHPHGIVSVSTVTNFTLDPAWIRDRFPWLRYNLLTLNMNMIWPFWRDWLMAYGFASVERSSCDRILASTETGKVGGNSGAIVIVVGGAREALDAAPGSYDLTLNSRNGFFRLALRHGALLFPILNFGENDVYDQIRHPWIRRLQQVWHRTFGFSTPYFFGRGVFNYRFGWLPRRVPITTVIGAPIDVGEPKANPTEAEVVALRAKYISALKTIYREHRKAFEVVPSKHGVRIMQ